VAGVFRAVEADFRVSAVAERLVAGLAAAAKRVLFLDWVFLPLFVIERFTLRIGDNHLFAERQSALHHVRPVFCNRDLRFRLLCVFHTE